MSQCSREKKSETRKTAEPMPVVTRESNLAGQKHRKDF